MNLVVGATGLLGGRIVKKLLSQGKPVRILVRPGSPCEELASQGRATSASELVEAGAQLVSGDLRDPLSLDTAVLGVDTVLTTAASTLRDFDIQNVDLNGTKSLIDAACRAHVKHFIYTSAHIADTASQNPVLQIKGLIEQYLKGSGLTYTILSPGIFMEVWIGMVVGTPLQANQPVSLIGQGDHRHSFVSIEDVASFGAAVVDNPLAYNQNIAIGGLGSYSWTEIIASVGKAVGQPLPVSYVGMDQPVPLLLPGPVDMLRAMENSESFIDMQKQVSMYGVELTPIDTTMRRMFVGG